MYTLVASDEEKVSNERRSSESLPQDGYNNPAGGLRNGKRVALARYLPRFSCNLGGLITILILNVLFCYFTYVLLGNRNPQDKGAQEAPLAYSPVLNHIDLPFIPKQMDAHQYINQSIYVSPPSPEVDRAWNKISDNIIFGITHEDVVSIGKDPDRAIPFNPEWNLGSDLYIAEIDVFHQIHCLNTLRKALITNYDYYWGQKWGFEPPIDFKTHLQHCTSMLLQGLMCHADAEVITHEWHEDQPWPFPDFGVVKQCRDFDAILNWAEENDIEESHKRYMDYRPPPGVVRIPMEKGTKEIIGEATGFNHGAKTQKIDFKGCNV